MSVFGSFSLLEEDFAIFLGLSLEFDSVLSVTFFLELLQLDNSFEVNSDEDSSDDLE